MSGGWEVGDLALCVNATPNNRAGHNGGLVKNKVYRVSKIINSLGVLGLNFEELPAPQECLLKGFWAHRFRKIKPDTEPCEEEFTTLIKRGRKVDA